MTWRRFPLALLVFSTFSLAVLFVSEEAISCLSHSEAMTQALSDDPALAQQGISALRARGAEGLRELLAYRESLLAQATQEPAEDPAMQDQLKQLDVIIDWVAGQLHGSVSQLFWYTDFDEASAVAHALNKPILSLRLLGELTEECSCANSRFFRTVLYSNEAISAKLREHFILHWETVRPVPVITIDFGDGRVIRRTVTGNSAHFLLDANGRPLDVLPGLYGPAPFESWLDQSLDLYSQWLDPEAGLDLSESDEKRLFLARFHDERLAELRAKFFADMETIGISFDDVNIETFTQWSLLVELHAEDAQLDAASIALMRRQNPTATNAARLAISKEAVEDPLVRTLRNFQSAIALDSVRNEFDFHYRIHHWFALDQGYQSGDSRDFSENRQKTQDRQTLMERVYAELFLTPSSDPWLGLVPPDTYAALPNNGLDYSPFIAAEERVAALQEEYDKVNADSSRLLMELEAMRIEVEQLSLAFQQGTTTQARLNEAEALFEQKSSEWYLAGTALAEAEQELKEAQAILADLQNGLELSQESDISQELLELMQQ